MGLSSFQKARDAYSQMAVEVDAAESPDPLAIPPETPPEPEPSEPPEPDSEPEESPPEAVSGVTVKSTKTRSKST
jgi:hypothetical protein